MLSLRRSPLPVLGGAFGAILVILGVMVAASDSVGRALVARHETEVYLAELSHGAERLQARVSEQVSTYQDFLRAPGPIRLQLYRAAQQAVLDQLAVLHGMVGANPELEPYVQRIEAMAQRWDLELGWVAQQAPQSPATVDAVAAALGPRADELAREFADTIGDLQDRLEELRAANRQTGQALADVFQLVVRLGGVIGALLVVAVGVVSGLTIRRSVQELAASRRAVVQAQESIRREVAERLHGEVQGKLLALELQLRQALAGLERDPTVARQAIEAVVERLGTVRDTARAISHQLHPAILRMGLPAALRSLRDTLEPSVVIQLEVAPEIEQLELRRSFGMDPAASAGRPPLSEEARLALYRLVQEAVNNAVRHGGAAEVAVRLWSPQPGQLAVCVEDHGRGFPRGSRPGLGLASLRGALEALGGSLEVVSRPGAGTRVIGCVPLTDTAAARGAPPGTAVSVR